MTAAKPTPFIGAPSTGWRKPTTARWRPARRCCWAPTSCTPSKTRSMRRHAACTSTAAICSAPSAACGTRKRAKSTLTRSSSSTAGRATSPSPAARPLRGDPALGRCAHPRQAGQGFLHVRLNLQRDTVARDGSLAPAELFVDLRPRLDVLTIPRGERDGAFGVGQARGVPAGQVLVPGAAVVAVRVVRRDRDRPAVVGDGEVVEALVLVDEAALLVEVSVLAIERDRVGFLGQGLVVQPFVVVAASAIVVGQSEPWIEGDRLRLVGDRLIV